MKTVLLVSLLLWIVVGIRYESYNYKELSYFDVMKYFYDMKNAYPDLITLETVHSKYNVPHQAGNWGRNRCIIPLVTITDKKYHNEYKPQVYISGTVHGNERLGANVATYLTEYLLTHYDTDPFVKKLLQQREILIAPFVNAQGYFRNEREEITDLGFAADINRDFPYNRKEGDYECFTTVGARATFKIFQNNLIIGALSYHAGQETIGYPWGSYNHVYKEQNHEKATETPDHKMFDRMTDVLLAETTTAHKYDFSIGEMTNLIYAWYGSLDDWAYAAGWERSPNSVSSHCSPRTYQPYNHREYFSNTAHISTNLMIIEASDNKDPPESEYGDKRDIYCRDCESEGYINRHLRLCLAYIDMIQPYPVIRYPKYSKQENVVTLFWKLNGCLTVNSMSIEIKMSDENNFITYDKGSGKCNWEGEQTEYEHKIGVDLDSEEDAKEFHFRIRFKADQDFANQFAPDPPIPQVTHVNKLRLEEDYTYSANGKKITNVPTTYAVKIEPSGEVSFYEVHVETDEYIQNLDISY